MQYFVMVVAIACSATLFRLGGAGGFWGYSKILRRVGLPLMLFGVSVMLGVNWVTALISYAALSGGLWLGYGETYGYWYKFMVGCLWAIPSVLMGITAMIIVLPVVWVVMFKLSNTEATAQIFKWQYVELATGALIGLTYMLATGVAIS